MPLSDEDCSCISGPIALTEAENVDQLPISMSPGPHRISGEFSNVFKPVLCPIFSDIFTYTFDINSVRRSFIQGDPVLIPKSTGKKKVLSLDGYRPIPHSIGDCRIFAKVLPHRLLTKHVACRDVQYRPISTLFVQPCSFVRALTSSSLCFRLTFLRLSIP